MDTGEGTSQLAAHFYTRQEELFGIISNHRTSLNHNDNKKHNFDKMLPNSGICGHCVFVFSDGINNNN